MIEEKNIKNKLIVLGLVKVISTIVGSLSFLWAIIEFILYLVKDKVFNWWSVWTFCINIIVIICIVTYMVRQEVKKHNKKTEYSEEKIEDNTKYKSKFQQRLEEAQRRQQNSLNKD